MRSHLREPAPRILDAVYDAMIHDGLWDAYNDYHMGNTGEVVAERWKVSREDQDAFALRSQLRAARIGIVVSLPVAVADGL